MVFSKDSAPSNKTTTRGGGEEEEEASSFCYQPSEGDSSIEVIVFPGIIQE